eukprot:scaffold42078_cov30-Tisochrysis_lutea.AAC.1
MQGGPFVVVLGDGSWTGSSSFKKRESPPPAEKGGASPLLPPPPRAASLATAHTGRRCQPCAPHADESLIDRSVMCYWDGAGWLQGTVVEKNTDEEELDGEEVANWVVYYDVDDTTAAHLRHADTYFTAANGDDDDGGSGSWARRFACAEQGAWYLLSD